MIKINVVVISLIFICCSMSLAFAQSNLQQRTSNPNMTSCNKLAIYELRQCLVEHGANDNQHCWTDSHLAYQECHFAMNNRSAQPAKQPATKEQLKKIQRLSKKVRAKTIKSRLMGAANTKVFQQVVAQSVENFGMLLALKGANDKQGKQLNAKYAFYRQLQNDVDRQVSCAEIKQHMNEFAQQQQSEYRRSAYREIKKLLPIYCRLTSN